MVSNNHYIELWINNQPIEIESQDSLNLRLNNVLFRPTETSTSQGEYSYSFDIPSTPNNNKVFDYANNLSKVNKFRTRYSAQVYSDGILIFNGSLTVQKYDAKEKMYTCNLVSIKISTLEDIFGEDVLTDVKWMVDFNGASTINSVNSNSRSKYFFPLISYGSFAKVPVNTDAYGVQDEYSSKYVIDNTNRFWVDSFYPSLNMLEELKKCFEYKGYKVGGNAFHDPIINSIYCSTNLADEQDPIYNVGNPKFGSLSLNVTYNSNNSDDLTNTIPQNLKFPYEPVSLAFIGNSNWESVDTSTNETEWNLEEVFINPLLTCGNVSINSASAMFEPSSKMIIIPADGFYKIMMGGVIELTQTAQLQTTNQTVVYHQYDYEPYELKKASELNSYFHYVTVPVNIKTTMPIEIQLVKNYDENLELIKGKNNQIVVDGRPSHSTFFEKNNQSNFINYQCCYPHEKNCYSFITDHDKIGDSTIVTSQNGFYIQGDDDIMVYDPIVSDAFICGWSTMGNSVGGGTCAFIKNGYSWSKTRSSRTDALYNQSGYYSFTTENSVVTSRKTQYNANELESAPQSYFSVTGNRCIARVSGVVYLHKNDKLEIMGVRRGYWNDEEAQRYKYTANISLEIEAISPENIYKLKSSDFTWNSSTRFPTQLNLFNFTNNETKISDWLKNIAEAFNLEYVFDGTNVDVNVNKGIKKDISYSVDIDDRVNSDEAESEYISYPREMSVRYKIDTDEHGFYNSVPLEHINDDDWKNWGDSGYTIIQLNDDSYETSNQNKSTNFSYTWYDNFQFNRSGQNQIGISIPVISNEEYMIDNYDYENSMAHRGYNLPQRFWFRGNSFGVQVPTENDYTISSNSVITRNNVSLYSVKNQKNRINLSYKDTEISLVTEYFNIHPMLSSNYVIVDVYLTPEEYKLIKDGATVHFDDDIYYVSEIQGHDPSGSNPTTLKLIKKV